MRLCVHSGACTPTRKGNVTTGGKTHTHTHTHTQSHIHSIPSSSVVWQGRGLSITQWAGNGGRGVGRGARGGGEGSEGERESEKIDTRSKQTIQHSMQSVLWRLCWQIFQFVGGFMPHSLHMRNGRLCGQNVARLWQHCGRSRAQRGHCQVLAKCRKGRMYAQHKSKRQLQARGCLRTGRHGTPGTWNAESGAGTFLQARTSTLACPCVPIA